MLLFSWEDGANIHWLRYYVDKHPNGRVYFNYRGDICLDENIPS